ITVSTYEIHIGGDLRWLWFRRGGVDGGGGRDAEKGEGGGALGAMRRMANQRSRSEDGEPEIAMRRMANQRSRSEEERWRR
ncbi:hypothetical protein U1Q18_022857, partial [Sarracenia purpurea var. burkii]